jgi:hypothetical protein
LRGGSNLFAYAPNPFGWVDPVGLNKKCPECPRKTIIEEDSVVAKEAKMKPQQQKDYEQVKDMLSQGEPGRNQHDLGGDLKGKELLILEGVVKGKEKIE